MPKDQVCFAFTEWEPNTRLVGLFRYFVLSNDFGAVGAVLLNATDCMIGN